jgi:hypothetical protein
MTTTDRLRCPIHGIPDCSPLLNGCSLVIRATRERDGEPFDQPTQPTNLLAVVVDIQGRRYYRWSYDVNTFEPWKLMGAVHVGGIPPDEPDTFRWSDLPAVAVISRGVPA